MFDNVEEMLIKRHILSKLKEWKKRPDHKPLLLRGAGQVGKTTVIRDFCKSYEGSIMLNLEKEPDRLLFETFSDAKTLIDALFMAKNVSSDLNKTLLFIDEIQESPKAIQLLRYLYEELPDLDVIAAGSLLEFALKDVKSFPVGRIEYLYMYPVNFMEFLGAKKHDRALGQMNKIPIADFAHGTLMNLFHEYAVVGGMPEVVKHYVEDGKVHLLDHIYDSIWSTYKDDIEKYARNNSEKNILRYIMDVAPLLIDERIKFQNFGNSNYRSREVGEAMRSLDDAKIIRLIYPTTSTDFPIIPDIKKAPRMQFLDTGLVNFTLNIQSKMLGMSDLSDAYRGRIIPHIIYQELISIHATRNETPHFWVREKKQSNAELDILLSVDQQLMPIEIKSGSTGTLKSLHQYIDQTNQKYAVRIYGGVFKVEKAITPNGTPYTLMNLPYYLGTKLPEYISWFYQNH